MFNNFHRFSGEDPEVQQANWEGWTPPWMQAEGHGPHGHPGPKGPFGPGHGGHGHHHGHGWRGPRGPFGRGFGFFGPGHGWDIPDELLALRAQAAEVGRLFMIASRGAFENRERLGQLRGLLDRTHKELSDMIYGASQSQPTAGSTGEGAAASPDVEQA